MRDTKLIKKSGKAVVVDPVTNRALILRLNEAERTQRNCDEWHLPGGAQESGDKDLAKTAQRETLEETGIATSLIGLVGEVEWDAYYENVPTHFIASVFELESDNGTSVRLSGEHSEAAWVSSANLDDYPALTSQSREAIQTVLLRREQRT